MALIRMLQTGSTPSPSRPSLAVHSLELGLQVLSELVQRPTSKALGELPLELILHCFSFMELKALITCQGISNEWRRFVELADIISIRRPSSTSNCSS